MHILQYCMGLLYDNDTSINDYECTGYVYLTINLVLFLFQLDIHRAEHPFQDTFAEFEHFTRIKIRLSSHLQSLNLLIQDIRIAAQENDSSSLIGGFV
jgi:hypothetical protein